MKHMHLLIVGFTAAAFLVLPPALIAQTHAEVIRGRVTTDSGAAISAATVIATMAPDRQVFRTATDASGAYRIDVPAGTGDYLVYISAPDRLAFRKRVTRTATETEFVVDAKLRSEVTQVAPVTVRSTKLTPTRGIDGDLSNPGDRDADGVDGAIAADEQGNLAAIAGVIPGLTRTADGFSALGLPSSQNNITLNGMAFPGLDIPRDSRVSVRVSTTPFDPSIGWFSGAGLDVRPTGPGLYTFRRARIGVDGASAGLPGAAPAFSAGYSASGRVDYANRFSYSMSAQARRRSPSYSSLFENPTSIQRDLGVSPDSLARLQSVLDQLGIGSMLDAPARPVTESGSLLFRIEKNPNRGATALPTAYGLDLFAGGSRSGGMGLSPSAAASTAWTNRQGSGSLGAFVSHYVTPDFLLEGKSSVSGSATRRNPYNDLPAGRVYVTSTNSDGTTGVRRLTFGGSGAGQSEARRLTLDNSLESRFYLPGNYAHSLKITGRVRFDAERSERAGSSLFSFASLDDLAANRAESYTRNTSPAPASAGVVNAFLSASDFWKPRENVQVNYGLRLEGATYTTQLEPNSAVEQALGLNTARVPGSFHVSPRLGFSWRRGRSNGSYRTNDLGAFRLSAGNVLRGGIGEFRNITSPRYALDALAASRATTTLTCIDAATPTPDWTTWEGNPAAIPSSCASAGPAGYVDASKVTHSFAEGFEPSRSWRGNLSYTMRPFGIAMSIDATASYNLNQAGIVERNLGDIKFTTADEGRPVYSPASAISPSSGLVAGGASHADAALGSVIEHRSDLRSFTQQYTVTAMPRPTASNVVTRFAYTFRQGTESMRGFDRSTFGDPTAVTWSKASTPRHQLQGQLGYLWAASGVSVSGIARATSGSFFTPIVGSDVNGDGFANDRAFVFGNGASGSATLDGALNALIAGAPSRTRDCLQGSRGAAASRNMCAGPWQLGLDGMVRINRPDLRRRRVNSIQIGLANVPALLDATLHGSQLRGWGQSSLPDPVLYHVRGFDAAAGRYLYEVNPAFGTERPALGRLLAPFRLSIDVSIDVGTSIPRQQFNNWVLLGRAGKPGTKLTAQELRTRYSGQVPDLYGTVLQLTDSLLLLRFQVDSLNALRRDYRARLDSIWTRVADEMVRLGDDFDQDSAFTRQEAAMAEAWTVNWHAARDIMAVLTSFQRPLLGGYYKTLLKMKSPGIPLTAR